MHRVRSVPIITVLMCLSAACSSSRRDAAQRHATSVDSLAGRALPAADTARTVLVTAHDYSFSGVPARIRSGWLTLRLVNAGREVHMLAISRVPNGHSAQAVLDAIAHSRPVPETSDWGGPNAVSPGDTATVTMFFPAGDYAMMCAVESPDGKMHALHGMMAIMTVTGGTDSTTSPQREDAIATLTDYHVALRGALAAGERTVRVRNDASQGHDLEILEMVPGHSAADAMRWFEHPAREAPTARAVGGVVEMHPGQEAFVTAVFRPGSYLFLCWVPDASGRPHFLRGMHQAVTVAAR